MTNAIGAGVDAELVKLGKAFLSGESKQKGRLGDFASRAKAVYGSYAACIEAESFFRSHYIDPFVPGIKFLAVKLPRFEGDEYAAKVAKDETYAAWWQEVNTSKKNARANSSYTWARMLEKAWPDEFKAAKAAKATTPEGLKKAGKRAGRAKSAKQQIAALRAVCAQSIKVLQNMPGGPCNITGAVAGFEAALLALTTQPETEATATPRKPRKPRKPRTGKAA